MFVEQLNSEQKSALVSLFTYVARADGRLDGSEWHYLNRFCEVHGLTYDMNEELSLAKLCEPFYLHKAKMIALVETVKMAISDLDYDVQESECLKEIVKRMGLDDKVFDKINDWALEGLKWTKHGVELINDLPNS